MVGQDRTLALLRSRLDLINQVAHLHDATVNDLLLAVIAGGLRGLLRCRGESVEGVTLPVYVPVSLRRGRSGQKGGNLISQMVVPLPLGIADPAERLREIALETAKRKAIRRPSLGAMFGSRLVRPHINVFAASASDELDSLVKSAKVSGGRAPQLDAPG